MWSLSADSFLFLLLNANTLTLWLLVQHAQSRLVFLSSALPVESIEEVMSETKPVPDVHLLCLI